MRGGMGRGEVRGEKKGGKRKGQEGRGERREEQRGGERSGENEGRKGVYMIAIISHRFLTLSGSFRLLWEHWQIPSGPTPNQRETSFLS